MVSFPPEPTIVLSAGNLGTSSSTLLTRDNSQIFAQAQGREGLRSPRMHREPPGL